MLSKSQVKYIQSLGQKKQRDEEGVFIAEGPKIISELLSSPHSKVVKLLALKEWADANHSGDIETSIITEEELAKISQLHTPNQVLAVVKKWDEPVVMQTAKTFSLALDTIQDPGNLGTILRIADWFGVTQIICNNDCADSYNPKVVQASMGSISRVKMLYTELSSWLKAQDQLPIYAAALEGQDVTAMKKIVEGILVIGNESKGISPAVFSLVSQKITIPRIGHAESLNAAVATGIILSHVR